MSPTWRGAAPPAPRILSPSDRVRLVVRGAAVGAVVFGGLALHSLVRLVERPLHGARRPWTPHITCAVCRAALRLLRIRLTVRGRPMEGAGAMVANHSSWLDIFALNAPAPLVFVAKEEVAGWGGIGWLARATGTVFVRRDRREAAAQVAGLRARLAAGERLLFFPEGTSSDGRRVLPFKPTLFAAFLGPSPAWLQPVSVAWEAPAGAPETFYGWWGDMGLAPHLAAVRAARAPGAVTVTFHPPVPAEGDRKALARVLEATVRAGLEADLSPSRRTGP